MSNIKRAKKARAKFSVNIDTVKLTVAGMHFEIPGATVATVQNSKGYILKSYGNRVSVKGKYGAHNIHARTMRSGEYLVLEGSPFAHRYGQNVYTSNDLLRGCRLAIKRVVQELKIEPSDDLRKKWREGNISLSRVDLAVNFRLGSEAEVQDVLKQIGRQLHERGIPMRSFGSTVYWVPRDGKEHLICFYAKGEQMRQAHRYADLPQGDRLIKHCEKILRVELRLRASELRELGLDKASAWDCDTPEKVFRKYMAKLKLLNVTSGPLNVRDLDDVPARLKPVMALHKSGVDLKLVYSKRTCQRHTSFFGKRGIDLHCPNQPVESITSLRKFLSPEKVINIPPRWMKKLGLVPLSAEKTTAMREARAERPGEEVKKTGSTADAADALESLNKISF